MKVKGNAMKLKNITFIIAGTVLCFSLPGTNSFAADTSNNPNTAITSSSTANIQNDVTVKLLPENKKVIPLFYKEGRYWTTNIKTPDIIISNNSNANIEISDVDIVGKINGSEVVRQKVDKNQIKDLIEGTNPTINKYGNANDLKPRFGKYNAPKDGFSEKPELKPNSSTVITICKHFWFSYIGTDKIDSIELEINISKPSGEKNLIKFPVKMTMYESKQGYIFPLDGPLMFINLPMNYQHHRAMLSQEFGFDIIMTDIKMTSFSTPKPEKLSDFLIFHKDIKAIGDGTVVEIGDKFPDGVLRSEINAMVPKIGFKNAMAGNYIVIDHGNSEFAFYAHISEDTIRVKVGDKVKKSDVIALVGNTGNSSEPHLHFQLMDSPDFLEANGLPVMFENIPPSSMKWSCEKSNSLFASDFMLININK